MGRIIPQLKFHFHNLLWDKKLFLYLLVKNFYRLLLIFDQKFKENWKHWLSRYNQFSNEIVKKKGFGNFLFWLRMNDILLIKEVFVDKDYSLLNDFLPQKGDVIIDLGAGIGDYALLASLRVDKKGKVYNIAGKQELKNIEVVKMILKLMNKSESLIEFVKDRPGHDLRYSLDISKIEKLGWKPKTKFEEGIRKTIEWYKNNERWWKPIIEKEEIDFHKKFKD